MVAVMAVRRRATTEVMSDSVRERLQLLLSSSAQPRRGDPTPGLPSAHENVSDPGATAPGSMASQGAVSRSAAVGTLIEEKGVGWRLPVPERGAHRGSGPDPDQTVVRPALRGRSDLSPPATGQPSLAITEPADDGSEESGERTADAATTPTDASAPAPSDASAPGKAGVWDFGRRHLQVIGALLALGVLLGGFALTRARSHPVTPPAIAAPLPSTSAAPSGEPQPTAAPELMVHVLGAVNRPGVYRLPGGARVVDAVDAAGGLTAQARPGELNFAQALDDGQQVLVGAGDRPGGEVRSRDGDSGEGQGGTSDQAKTGGAGGSGGSGAKVNLNRATVDQLDTLPGVGPVTAGKIIAWRDQNKKFSRIEELQEVPGIGPKSYAELAPLVTV